MESDPEIFTNYMASMGLPPNWIYSELYGFEQEMLGLVPRPVVALILNAEYNQKRADRPQGSLDTVNKYYMKQTNVLDNACGVIACIHAILNNLGDGANKIQLKDGVLSKFIADNKDKSAAERASALEGFADFQNIHKTFASQGGSEMPSD